MCYWPLLRAPFTGTVFSQSLGIASSARLCFYALLAICGFCLATRLTPMRMSSWLENRRQRGALALGFGLVASIGSALMAIASFADLHGTVVLAGTLLVTLGFSGLTVVWTKAAVADMTQSALLCGSLSFLLSFLFGMFDFFTVALRVLSVLLPCLSGAFLLLHSCCCEQITVVPAEAQGLREPHSAKRDIEPYALGFSILGLLASGCIGSLWSSGVGYAMEPFLILTYVESICMAALFFVFYLIVHRMDLATFYGLIALTLFMLVGVCLCVLVGAKSALGITATSRTCFEFCLWAMVVLVICRNNDGFDVFVGLFLVSKSLGSILPSYVWPFFLGIDGNAQGGSVLVAAVFALVVIAFGLVALVAVFGFRYARDAADSSEPLIPVQTSAGGPASSAASLQWMQRYGLTEREAEVALLVAQGNSVKRVAELTCVAPSTVQSHMKSIYRKMGIHSRQSLVDLMGDAL